MIKDNFLIIRSCCGCYKYIKLWYSCLALEIKVRSSVNFTWEKPNMAITEEKFNDWGGNEYHSIPANSYFPPASFILKWMAIFESITGTWISLHVRDLSLAPSQSALPNAGSGLVYVRYDFSISPPQVSEHCSHDFHVVHLPLTTRQTSK